MQQVREGGGERHDWTATEMMLLLPKITERQRPKTNKLAERVLLLSKLLF